MKNVQILIKIPIVNSDVLLYLINIEIPEH